MPLQVFAEPRAALECGEIAWHSHKVVLLRHLWGQLRERPHGVAGVEEVVAFGEGQNYVEAGGPSSLSARSGRVDCCSQSVPGDLGTFCGFERPAKVEGLWSLALVAVTVEFARS